MEEKELISLKCKKCGENLRLRFTSENGIEEYVCDYCGTTAKYENKSKTEEFLKNEERYNSIVSLRINSDFAEVISRCNELIKENPKLAYPYIERLYAKYGIQFPSKDEYKATFYDMPVSINEDKKYDFTTEKDYIKAYSLASDSEKKQYEKIAKDINLSVARYQEIFKNTEDFDVFISYKRTTGELDENGKEILTEDCTELAELRNNLISKKGLKVFMAPYSIKKGIEYEPQIYSALIKSKVMVLYGSRSDFFSAQWVKNEWKRFLDKNNTELFKKNEFGFKLNGSLIVVTNGVNPTLLPKELQKIQLITTRQIDSDINVFDTIDRQLAEYYLYKDGATKGLSSVKISKIDTNLTDFKMSSVNTRSLGSNDANRKVDSSTNALLNTALSKLKIRRYEEASKIYAQVLEKIPNNGQALKGKFLADHKVNEFSSFINESLYSNIDDFTFIIESVFTKEAEEIISILCDNLLNKSPDLNIEKREKIFKIIAQFNFTDKDSFLNKWENYAINNCLISSFVLSLKYHSFKNANEIKNYIEEKIKNNKVTNDDKGREFLSSLNFELIKYKPNDTELIQKCLFSELEKIKSDENDLNILNALSKVCDKDNTTSYSNYVINFLRYTKNEQECDEFISKFISALSDKSFTSRPLVLRWLLDNVYVLYSPSYNLSSDLYKLVKNMAFIEKQGHIEASIILKVISLFNTSSKENDIKKVLYLACSGLCHLYDIKPEDVFNDILSEDDIFKKFKHYDLDVKEDDLRIALIDEGIKISTYDVFSKLLENKNINSQYIFINDFEEHYQKNYKVYLEKKKVEEKEREIYATGVDYFKRNKYQEALNEFNKLTNENVISEANYYKSQCLKHINRIKEEKETKKIYHIKNSPHILLMKLLSSYVGAIVFGILFIVEIALFSIVKFDFLQLDFSVNEILKYIMIALAGISIFACSFITKEFTKEYKGKIVANITNESNLSYFVYLLHITIFPYLCIGVDVSMIIPLGLLVVSLIINIFYRQHKTCSFITLVYSILYCILHLLIETPSSLITTLPFVIITIGAYSESYYRYDNYESSSLPLAITALFISELINGIVILPSTPLLDFSSFDLFYHLRFELLILAAIPALRINNECYDQIPTFVFKILYRIRNYAFLLITYFLMFSDVSSTNSLLNIYGDNASVSFIIIELYIILIPFINGLIDKLILALCGRKDSDLDTCALIFQRIYKAIDKLFLVVVIVRAVYLLIVSDPVIYETFNEGVILAEEVNKVIPITLLVISIISFAISFAFKKKRHSRLLEKLSDFEFNGVHSVFTVVSIIAIVCSLVILFINKFSDAFPLYLIIIMAFINLVIAVVSPFIIEVDEHYPLVINAIVSYLSMHLFITAGESNTILISIPLIGFIFLFFINVLKEDQRDSMVYGMYAPVILQLALRVLEIFNPGTVSITIMSSLSFISILICCFVVAGSKYNSNSKYASSVVAGLFIGEILISLCTDNLILDLTKFDPSYMLRYDIMIFAYAILTISEESLSISSNVTRYLYLIRNILQVIFLGFLFYTAKDGQEPNGWLSEALNYFENKEMSVMWMYLYGFITILGNVVCEIKDHYNEEKYKSTLQIISFSLSCIVALLFVLKAFGVFFGFGSCGAVEGCNGGIDFIDCTSAGCDCSSFFTVLGVPLLSFVVALYYPFISSIYVNKFEILD